MVTTRIARHRGNCGYVTRFVDNAIRGIVFVVMRFVFGSEKQQCMMQMFLSAAFESYNDMVGA